MRLASIWMSRWWLLPARTCRYIRSHSVVPALLCLVSILSAFWHTLPLLSVVLHASGAQPIKHARHEYVNLNLIVAYNFTIISYLCAVRMLICAVRMQVANAQAVEPQQAEAMGAAAGGGGGASHGPPPPGDGIDQDLQARLNNLRKT